MKAFASLYTQLERLTGTRDKREVIKRFFQTAAPEDAAWALWLLAGGKLRGIAKSGELRRWAGEITTLPDWLVEESYHHVGDLAETISLLLPASTTTSDVPLHEWIEQRLMPLKGADESVRRAAVTAAWDTLDGAERLVFNKLLTGNLRIGVSARSVQQALADMSGIDIARIAQRMLGDWSPTPQFMRDLLDPDMLPSDRKQPFPFFLASALENPVEELGPVSDWLLEWKWDGIRVQLIIRDGEVALWSRGEERLDGRFPEIEAAAAVLGRDAVMDGELIAWRPGEPAPMPFTALQKRIQLRKPSAKTLAATPVRFLAFDLLEDDGADIRQSTLGQRRGRLQYVLADRDDETIALSPHVQVADWQVAGALRDDSRERGVEGLMLKRLTSSYQVGRRRGDWWKWKIAPLTLDAVLIYAQAGHGRRSNIHSDYTFGVWDGEALVPVAKAYSGLTDKEILKLDAWIRKNTLQRFGPVRSVPAQHVFELAFEAVNLSSRHKSGVAVRFPRILRWRQDKPVEEADRLETLKALAR